MDSYSDVYEAMNGYYKLKTAYEEKVRSAKLAIHNTTTNKKGQSISTEKRNKLIRNYVPKCISCNKKIIESYFGDTKWVKSLVST